ncbi:Pkinase-domain-containing protein [Ceraceosorus guamensis]|uniref:non-specific serine/threonine protein kinase n=1 Tax=Ceraceosorus guamensis TaxID=1522189 RepID=A0A316VQ89_9BASI|nr:Pkinase-domain-containing protein [Ceraceosorus guamensis]PWN39692.1 Pkinase-domain-containing protein [Ceraceosorus guamensis]
MLPGSLASMLGSSGHASSLIAGGSGAAGSSGLAAGGTLKLNGRSLNIIRLLGEGGFSFVYLARDKASGRDFALKQMRCPSGTPTLRLALAEIETTRRFRSPHIIRLLDSCVEQTADGHIVYLFLPLFRGNAQDEINARAVRGESANEKHVLLVFRGAARGLKAMHQYRLPNVGAQREQQEAQMQAHSREDLESHDQQLPVPASQDDEDDSDSRRLIDGHEGADDEDDGSYPPKPRPEMTTSSLQMNNEQETGREGDLVPWAHRDIKPANIMIAQERQADGTLAEPVAVLMDFGSALRGRIHIKSRREAIMQQDLAAEHSSMPYRAPELFDVKTDAKLDEKVDIWSLGATLFAHLYGYSPFETPQIVEQGGSVAMTVQTGTWKFPEPASSTHSQATKDIIRRCLVLDPKKRPDIDEVLELTEKALRALA